MAFRRWFPRSLPKQAAFFANFTKAFIKIAVDLGFTEAEVENLKADNAVMQYMAQTEMNLKTFKKSFQKFREHLTQGKNVAEPVYLQYSPLTEPPIVLPGIFDRLFRLADRITAADGYTTAIGARLGILSPTREALRPEDLELKLKAKPLNEAQVSIGFTRGRTNGINLYFQHAGNEEWFDLGRFFYSPAIVTIPLVEADKPEQIYLRGRYLIGNEAVGSYSNIMALVITP